MHKVLKEMCLLGKNMFLVFSTLSHVGECLVSDEKAMQTSSLNHIIFSSVQKCPKVQKFDQFKKSEEWNKIRLSRFSYFGRTGNNHILHMALSPRTLNSDTTVTND